MKAEKLWVAGGVVLAVSVAALVGAQAQSGKTAPSSAVVMPKSDRIPMADFKKLYAANNVVVLDVRSTEAYQSGHIPGALSVPEGTIDANLAEKLKRMGKPIATYCT